MPSSTELKETVLGTSAANIINSGGAELQNTLLTTH